MVSPNMEWVDQSDGTVALQVTLPKYNPDDEDEMEVVMTFLEGSVLLDESMGMAGAPIEAIASGWIDGVVSTMVERGLYKMPATGNINSKGKPRVNLSKMPPHPKKERVEKLRKQRDRERNKYRKQIDDQRLTMPGAI